MVSRRNLCEKIGMNGGREVGRRGGGSARKGGRGYKRRRGVGVRTTLVCAPNTRVLVRYIARRESDLQFRFASLSVFASLFDSRLKLLAVIINSLHPDLSY